MNDLRGILFLMLFGLPVIASVNLECRTHFLCINATHFHICGDFGDGKLRAIESVVFSCPPRLVCDETSINECHYPVITTTTEVTTVAVIENSTMTDLPITIDQSTQTSEHLNKSIKKGVVTDNNHITTYSKSTTDADNVYDLVVNTTDATTINESLRTHNKMKDVLETISDVNKSEKTQTPGNIKGTIIKNASNLTKHIAVKIVDNISITHLPHVTTEGITDLGNDSITFFPDITTEGNVTMMSLPEASSQADTRADSVTVGHVPKATSEGNIRADVSLASMPEGTDSTADSTRAGSLLKKTTEEKIRADNVNKNKNKPLPEATIEESIQAGNTNITSVPETAIDGSIKTDNGNIATLTEATTEAIRADKASIEPLAEVKPAEIKQVDYINTTPILEFAKGEGNTRANSISITEMPMGGVSTRTDNVNITHLPKVTTEETSRSTSVSVNLLPELTTEWSIRVDNASKTHFAKVTTEKSADNVAMQGNTRGHNASTMQRPVITTNEVSITPLPEVIIKENTQTDNALKTPLPELKTEGNAHANKVSTIHLANVTMEESASAGNVGIMPLTKLTTQETSRRNSVNIEPVLEVTKERKIPDVLLPTLLLEMSTEGVTPVDKVSMTPLLEVINDRSTQKNNTSIKHLPKVTTEGSQAHSLSPLEVTTKVSAWADNVNTIHLANLTTEESPRANSISIRNLQEGNLGDNVHITPLPDVTTEEGTQAYHISISPLLDDITTNDITQTDIASITPLPTLEGNTREDNASIKNLTKETTEKSASVGNVGITPSTTVNTQDSSREDSVIIRPLLEMTTKGSIVVVKVTTGRSTRSDSASMMPSTEAMTVEKASADNVSITHSAKVVKEESLRADSDSIIPFPQTTPEGSMGVDNVSTTLFAKVTTVNSVSADNVSTTSVANVTTEKNAHANSVRISPLLDVTTKRSKQADNASITPLSELTTERDKPAYDINITHFAVVTTKKTARARPLPDVTSERSARASNVNITPLLELTTETKADSTSMKPVLEVTTEGNAQTDNISVITAKSSSADNFSITSVTKVKTQESTHKDNVTKISLSEVTTEESTRSNVSIKPLLEVTTDTSLQTDNSNVRLLPEITTKDSIRADNASMMPLTDATPERSTSADNASTTLLAIVTIKKSVGTDNVSIKPLPEVTTEGGTRADVSIKPLLENTRSQTNNTSVKPFPKIITKENTKAGNASITPLTKSRLEQITSADNTSTTLLAKVKTEKSASVDNVSRMPLLQVTIEKSTQATSTNMTSSPEVTTEWSTRADTAIIPPLRELKIEGTYTVIDNVSITPLIKVPTQESSRESSVNITPFPKVTREEGTRADVNITLVEVTTDRSTRAYNSNLPLLSQVTSEESILVDYGSKTPLPDVISEGIKDNNTIGHLPEVTMQKNDEYSVRIIPLSELTTVDSLGADDINATVQFLPEVITKRGTLKDNDTIKYSPTKHGTTRVAPNITTDGGTKTETISTTTLQDKTLQIVTTIEEKSDTTKMPPIKTTEENISQENISTTDLSTMATGSTKLVAIKIAPIVTIEESIQDDIISTTFSSIVETVSNKPEPVYIALINTTADDKISTRFSPTVTTVSTKFDVLKRMSTSTTEGSIREQSKPLNSSEISIENPYITGDVSNAKTKEIFSLSMSDKSNVNHTQNKNFDNEMNVVKINNGSNTSPKYINLETNNTKLSSPAHLIEIKQTTSIPHITETSTLKDKLNMKSFNNTIAVMNTTAILPKLKLKSVNPHIMNISSSLVKQPDQIIQNSVTNPKLQGKIPQDENMKSKAINISNLDGKNIKNSILNIAEPNRLSNVSNNDKSSNAYNIKSIKSTALNMSEVLPKELNTEYISIVHKEKDQIKQENITTNIEKYKINITLNNTKVNKMLPTKQILEFECLTEGRFSDASTDQYYYICVKKNENFMRFKLRCQNGYHVNRYTVKCESNDENDEYAAYASSSATRAILKSSTTESSTEMVMNTHISRQVKTTTVFAKTTHKPISTVKSEPTAEQLSWNLDNQKYLTRSGTTTHLISENDTESEEIEVITIMPKIIERNTEPITVKPVRKPQEIGNVEIFKSNFNKEVKHDMPLISDIEIIQPTTVSTTSNLLFKIEEESESVSIDKGTISPNIYKESSLTSPLAETTETNKPIDKAMSVIEETTSKKDIEIPFKCPSKKSGKYAEPKNCRTFYICTGTDNPLIKACPIGTVFSDFTKQCTKNLAHCIRNNEFECSAEGRYRDIFSNTYYYICVKNNSHFIRFKLGCQKGYHVNEMTLKCVINQSNLESSSVSQDSSLSSSEQSTAEKETIEASTEKHRTKRRDPGFKCVEEGRFPDSDNCRKYYVCSKKKDRLRKKRKRCKKNEVFHKDKRRCVSAENYECQ